jgi:hypothetical protein
MSKKLNFFLFLVANFKTFYGDKTKVGGRTGRPLFVFFEIKTQLISLTGGRKASVILVKRERLN